jgi:hypothetical protein
MARPRTPIPGWSDDEVIHWFMTNRGTPSRLVSEMFGHLERSDRLRARSRAKLFRDRLKGQGVDFSGSATVEQAPKPAKLYSLPKPPSVAEQAEDPSPPRKRTPSPRSISPPDPPSKIENVAAMNRPAMLAWTINEAAAKAREMPSDKSAAAYFKLITELHTELDQLRKSGNGQEVTMEAILENIARMATGLPNKFLDEMLREHLRRNPKQHVTVKRAV